jgi:hypothetical protein
MHETIVRAFADAIVESLKARSHSLAFDSPPDTFAAVDLGEDHHEGDIYSVSVKFYWEFHYKDKGIRDRSLQTVLAVNTMTGLLEVGYRAEWGYLIPSYVDSCTDWIAGEAAALRIPVL